MPIIQTQNLSYVYGGGTPFEKTAIKNINISINSGEIIGIIGHTGSGKSTLVQQFNGLIKPTCGQVLLDGVNIWSNPKNIRNIRFKVGMVFQYPEYQLFEDTVLKDIAFGPINMSLSKEEVRRIIITACDFVGLDRNLLNSSPFDLSGGEKRKAAIAGVIAMDPDVLILDEPTAGLDPEGRDSLIYHILSYHEKRKNTILLVSHSMEDVAKVADRVLVMNDGEVFMFDNTKTVFSNAERLMKIGLMVPQITKIMMGLKNRGYNVDPGVLTVEQGVVEVLRLLSNKGDKIGR